MDKADMKREFADRPALVDAVRRAFPAAVAVDDHIAETVGGRAAAEQALATINPRRYRNSRNFLGGAVTRLSPYLRHGVLSLAEVRQAALEKVDQPQEAEKLINELGWRDYYQRVYGHLGQGIWHDLEPYKTGRPAAAYAAELPADIRRGQTGLACIDAFAGELHQTGYLHNHARMWLAAYVVHWRRVRWQAGAAWFLTHLLDGDPASNNLSWQWVASTFSHKPYYFNRENLEKYSGGVYCRDCPLRGRCDFEGSYEALGARLFRPEVEASAPDPHPLAGPAVPRPAGAMGRPVEGDVLVWVHGDQLSPHHAGLRAYPAAPALWVWDEELLLEWGLSLKRLVFLYECLLELPVTIQRGDIAARLAAAAAARQRAAVVTTPSPSPRFAAIVSRLEARGLKVYILPGEPFVPDERQYDLKRFSRYWRKARNYAFS